MQQTNSELIERKKGGSPCPKPSWDGGLAVETILGVVDPPNLLLRIIAERIRLAADHLHLSRGDLERIFRPHTVFEGETSAGLDGVDQGFMVVETYHEIEGTVGKGALKIVFPGDLLEHGDCYRELDAGGIEVLPAERGGKWASAAEAERTVRQTMRELMAGESLSMSLKCQATEAPFSGSEGLVLCAHRNFDITSGRYLLRPALKGGADHAAEDKELIEFMMNSTAELLTRAGRIGYDKIVHAAETNSTLTARLNLQLPSNVVEGHLRALLQTESSMIIGDEDMTPRLRQLLAAPDYRATRCALAQAAARMQMEHAILLPGSRQKLREALNALPSHGPLNPGLYRAIVQIFFGSGEVHQNEDRLFHHREPILRALSVALSAQCLDECGDSEVFSLYLRTLLDNQRVTMEALLGRKLPPGSSLPIDWFERCAPLDSKREEQLTALFPAINLDKEQVSERFLAIVDILFQRLAGVPENTVDPYELARREFLQLAIRAVTSIGHVLPPVERIVFFTLPFTYDCATPRLGVVTRKPPEVCGSELRPQAMALGAVMSIEIFLKRFLHRREPFEGLRVAVEGLGNAGKNVVRLLAEKGARIVGVSDSRGALLQPGGFTAQELLSILEHKDAGKRLDTWRAARSKEAPSAAATMFHSDPAMLKSIEADLLVLTALAGSIDQESAKSVPVKIVCELTGAAVTGPAKRILRERHVEVIPDNLASSGGLLVSLSEMLQNSAAQVWDRRLEERNLQAQLSAAYEAITRLAGDYNVDIPTASDILALRRMQELTAYRAHLDCAAAALAQRIQAIGETERVLVVLDDDEDGVASAAILRGLMEYLNPLAKGRVDFINASFRSEEVLHAINNSPGSNGPVRHVFVVDRSYPLNRLGQRVLLAVASRCRLTFINNHDLPPELLVRELATRVTDGETAPRNPSELGILLISPQTLRATLPARQFPTAMVLKELVHLLVADRKFLSQMDWQAAVGSYLDMPEDMPSQWLLFYSQFNPDKLPEAASAIKTMTRAGGYVSAINALAGIARPDQLETNQAWGQFLAEYRRLDERVQVLVEKILLENRRQPVTIHFFTHDEVASPTALARNASDELDLYHWISERLTQHGEVAEKPIIVGQVVRDPRGAASLGVRIRSPRGVDLRETGLPSCFESGGLPNTAVARIPLSVSANPRGVFEELVDAIWMKTVSPFHMGWATRRTGQEQPR